MKHIKMLLILACISCFNGIQASKPLAVKVSGIKGSKELADLKKKIHRNINRDSMTIAALDKRIENLNQASFKIQQKIDDANSNPNCLKIMSLPGLNDDLKKKDVFIESLQKWQDGTRERRVKQLELLMNLPD